MARQADNKCVAVISHQRVQDGDQISKAEQAGRKAEADQSGNADPHCEDHHQRNDFGKESHGTAEPLHGDQDHKGAHKQTASS